MKRCIIWLGLYGIACGDARAPRGLSGAGGSSSESAIAEPLGDPSASATAGGSVTTPDGSPTAPDAPSSDGAGAAPSARLPSLDPSIPARTTAGESSAGDRQPSGDAAPREGTAAEVPPSDDASPGETPAAGAPLVTVSFTFDDTYGSQIDAATILEAHGMRGTFYVNSPELHRATNSTNPNRPLNIAEVLAMQARGHDIGGHTLGHLSLTDVPEVERLREVLGDRAELMRLGIEARSFAYPYGHVEDDDLTLGRPVLEIARASGYTSARDTNGFELDDCARGPESRPPADAFMLRSTRSVNEPPDGAERRMPEDTAETLLDWVDQTARCGGGWLPLVFHHLRDDCSAADAPSYCFDFDELERLASALASGRRCPGGSDDGCYGVEVATVSAAMGSTALAPAPEVAGLRNPSLERTLDSGGTECILRTGEDVAAFSRSTLARTGGFSERLELAAPVDEVTEIGVERDYGACAIFAREGRTYELSLHYRAEPDDAPTLRFVTYRLTSDYDWERWEGGAAFAAGSPGQWVRAVFTTDEVPEDTVAISFGLRVESAGAINVDDFDSVPLGVASSVSND